MSAEQVQVSDLDAQSHLPLEDSVQFEFSVKFRGTEVDGVKVRVKADTTKEEQAETLNVVADHIARVLASTQEQWPLVLEEEKRAIVEVITAMADQADALREGGL